MKKIRYLFLILILSSCNQYVGTIDPDYIPKNEVTKIFSNIKNDTYNLDIEFSNIIYPKVNTVTNIKSFKINKILDTDKKSVVNFLNNKIFLSKGKSIYVFDIIDEKNNFNYELKLKKDEYVTFFFEFRDNIYLTTNHTSIFMLDGKNISLIKDYSLYSNSIPIITDETLIIFSVFGDIYEVNLNDSSIFKKANFNPNPGTKIKSQFFEDNSNIYYLFNTGTLITFNKIDYEIEENYILEDLNILSSLGFFREITSAPFNYNDHLYFLDRSGKIAVFNPITLSLHWEYDIGENIVYYLFSDNGNLFILSNNDIYVISNDGIIINTYNHNKELPILIFNINENLYLVSEDGITSINLNKKSEEKFYKNKFTANLDIYYQGQTIYLKDGKSLFKLSE